MVANRTAHWLVERNSCPIAAGFPFTARYLPDLGGERVVYLHSSVLRAGVPQVEGEGQLVSFTTSVPVTVFYGQQQTSFPNQHERPAIAYPAPTSIRSVNLTSEATHSTLGTRLRCG